MPGKNRYSIFEKSSFFFEYKKKEYFSKISFPASVLSHEDVQKKKRKKIGGLCSVSLL